MVVESYWIVNGLFSWLIAPPVAAWLPVPGFAEIIEYTNSSIFRITYFMGLLWAIVGAYALGIRYLNYFPMGGKISFPHMLSTDEAQMVLPQACVQSTISNNAMHTVSQALKI